MAGGVSVQDVQEAAKAGARLDGRKHSETRGLQLQCPAGEPSLTGSSGSASVSLIGGTSSHSVCVCAIKPELNAPEEAHPSAGSTRCSVEAVGSHETPSAYLLTLLQSLLGSDSVPFSLSRLVASSGKAVWSICCDAVFISPAAGSDCTALSLAASLALRSADFPSVIENDAGELELAEQSRWSLDVVPFVAIRIARVSPHNLGHASLLVDPDKTEEAASDALMDVVIRSHSAISCVRLLRGWFGRSDFRKALSLAQSAGTVMLTEADEQLAEQSHQQDEQNHPSANRMDADPGVLTAAYLTT